VIDGVATELAVDSLAGHVVAPGGAVALSFHALHGTPQPGTTGRVMLRTDDPLYPLAVVPIRVVMA